MAGQAVGLFHYVVLLAGGAIMTAQTWSIGGSGRILGDECIVIILIEQFSHFGCNISGQFAAAHLPLKRIHLYAGCPAPAGEGLVAQR